MIALGDYMGANCHACIGGTNVREDMSKLQAGQHIVVGTPGRVHDMISRRALSKFLNILCTCCLTMILLFSGLGRNLSSPQGWRWGVGVGWVIGMILCNSLKIAQNVR